MDKAKADKATLVVETSHGPKPVRVVRDGDKAKAPLPRTWWGKISDDGKWISWK